MNALTRLSIAAAITLAVTTTAQAQKGKASELQPAVKKTQTPPPAPAPAPAALPAPARFTADSTPTGVQLHWATVPGAHAYWIYRVAGEWAPDTNLIGNVPAANIPAGRDGAFFDPVHIKAEYRVRAVDVNNKSSNPARVHYPAR